MRHTLGGLSYVRTLIMLNPLRISCAQYVDCRAIGRVIWGVAMSDSGAIASDERERLACTRCGTDVGRADRFCRNCGLERREDASTIEAYLSQIVPGRVDAALKERFKEQKIVEVETAELLAERAMKWLRAFGFFLGIPAVLFAAAFSFFGLKTYSDITRVANQAADLEKILAGPQQQLARANRELVQLQADLASAKTTLGSQISQVGERQQSLEEELKTIATKVGVTFTPSSNLEPEHEKTILTAVMNFQTYLQSLGLLVHREEVRIDVEPGPSTADGKAVAYYDAGQRTIHVARPYASNPDVTVATYTETKMGTVPT
jgi:hypothetical protein